MQSQRLYWIDCTAGRIHRCTAEGGELRTWEVPERIGSMALRRDGGGVLALRSGFHSWTSILRR